MTLKTSRRKRFVVVLDSNALLVSSRFKLDIYAETERLLGTKPEFILLSAVKEELEKLGKKGSIKTQRNVELAIRLSERCTYVKTEKPEQSSVDDVIFDVASETKLPVFTNDRELRKRLRDINVPVIYVRQKSHLAMEGMIQPV